MSTQIEFSKFYKLLHEIKEGNETTKGSLQAILNEFKDGGNSKDFLQELGQNYLWIGVEELFKYSNSIDLTLIGQMSKEDWDDLANKNNCDLPVHLANKMINFVKENQITEKLSSKWGKSFREVEKHIMPMAAYITEGIIDVLE